MGDSNSGGQGSNNLISAYERAPRISTKIFNNYTLTFQTLDIGTNNLLQHQNLIDNSFHGLENGLANCADSGLLGPLPIYLLKAGSGGARVTWFNDSTLLFLGVNAWVQFTGRADSALKLMSVINHNRETPIYLIWSDGVNDASSNNASVWKDSTKSLIAKIRMRYGNVKVFHLHLPTDNNGFDAAITEMGAEITDYWPINTNGANLKNPSHWEWDGLKVIASRITAMINSHYIY